MEYIADLHIHSPFSRATSKASSLPGLAAWAKIKGIQVVGTGDFTHPGWFAQLRDNLVEAEPGFFRLRDERADAETSACRFVLTAEISSIYKRGGQVRKIHNLLYVPSLEDAARISARLAAIGNIESDGRPILGLDARNLLEILLESSEHGFLVPAHIWTPWFSLFGSKSGFDSIEDCYDDLTEHIFALETGLSSDPEMNRLISALDRYTLISNSDCHSPGKLGREANLFDCGFDYFSMRDSLKNPADHGFQGTIEFFPEEGKYHLDGHRKCQTRFDPVDTRKMDNICPVCGGQMTIGVLHRVLELADREKPVYPAGPKFHRLIPLQEVIGEIMGQGPNTKGVMAQYAKIITKFGSEFELLLHTEIKEINECYSPLLGTAVQRMREGRVIRQAGYDGEFGVIRVFEQGELADLAGQMSLCGVEQKRKKKLKKPREMPLFSAKQSELPEKTETDKKLNPEQALAVACPGSILVKAGPGTGKTHTLVTRLAALVAAAGIDLQRVFAITFTNRAADEIRERLEKTAGKRAAAVFVGTFHSFCLQWLRKEKTGLVVVGEEERDLLLRRISAGREKTASAALAAAITAFYQDNLSATAATPPPSDLQPYFNELANHNGVDLDGVIPLFVMRLNRDEAFMKMVAGSVSHLFIDEFQDLNQAQYQLVRILAAHAEIFAIGDADQAIYGFRGSSPDFFYSFPADCKAKEIQLVRNYRSAPNILQAAETVIRKNSRPGSDTQKALIPQHTNPGQILHYEAATTKAEAEFVVQHIEKVMGGISHFSLNSGRGTQKSGEDQSRSFGDIAVLYRMNQQATELSEALTRRGIPFQVVDVVPYYMTAEMRRLYYLMRIAADQAGMAEHLAFVKHLAGVGKTAFSILERELGLDGSDFFKEVKEIASRNKALTRRAEHSIYAVRNYIAEFRHQVETSDLVTSLAAAMQQLAMDPAEKNSVKLLELAGVFNHDLSAFADHLHRNAQGVVYDDKAEAVTLLTMHAAKGLEFPVVFITGAEEGLMPCTVLGRERVDVEEERRLFYVAMTRARETLVVVSAARRTLFGRQLHQVPSRFLGEIPADLINRIATERKKRKPADRQMRLF